MGMRRALSLTRLLLLTSLLAATVGALAVGAGAGPARAAATVWGQRWVSIHLLTLGIVALVLW